MAKNEVGSEFAFDGVEGVLIYILLIFQLL